MQTGDNIVCTRGLSQKQRRVIYDLHKKQLFTKLAQSVYYPTTEYADLSFRTRFWLRSLAYGIEGRTLTGRSAGCLHTLPILYSEECPVEIRGKGRREGLRMRNISRDATVTISFNGSPIVATSPAMTTVDLARWRGLGEAIRVGDAAVLSGRASLEEIGKCVALRKNGPGIANAREAVSLINGLAESPRESDVRVALYESGYPPPVQQAEIRTARGYFIGRVDFFYPERSLVLEYDGRGKTRGIDGGDPYKAINKERDRERSLISEGVVPIRITNDSFVSGAWLDSLARLWNARGPFPAAQWSATLPGRTAPRVN